MSDENKSPSQLLGGITAIHSEPGKRLLPVAPTTDHASNLVRPVLFPFACWKVNHSRFAFDSSLPHPDMKIELANLGLLIRNNSRSSESGRPAKAPLLSVFGHADPTGPESYNKVLAGRRARAVYALLTRNTTMWEELFLNQDGTNDEWGQESVKALHEFLGRPGNPPSDTAGREPLFLAYMDHLCSPASGGLPLKVDSSNFLGRGNDPHGKADYQGCGEFNPLLLLSQHDEDALPHEIRNERYQLNRRVVILLFRPETYVNAAKWPCPSTSEGVGGCKKRFFSDAAMRLHRDPSAPREFARTRDTFACRFYHRMTTTSPCEQLGGETGFLAVRIFFHARPMSELYVQFAEIGANGKPGTLLGDSVQSDDKGVAILPFAVPIGRYTVLVEYQKPKVICTVTDASQAEILVLPIGRPYWCVDGDIEFDPELR